MKKNFFGVMAAMMVLTLSCKKDKEPEAVDPLIDLTLICYPDNRAWESNGQYYFDTPSGARYVAYFLYLSSFAVNLYSFNCLIILQIWR